MTTRRVLTRWPATGVLVVAACFIPIAVTSNYTFGVLNLALIYAILTSGFNFTLGFTGRISLGHIGFWALGAYVTGATTTRMGLPIGISLVLGAVVAALIAWVVARLSNSLSAHYLALATLGFGQSVSIVATNWVSLTGGGNGISGIPPLGIFGFQADSNVSTYYVLLACTILGGLFTYRFKNSRLGRQALAVKQSEVAAASLGIDTGYIKTLTLVISAVYGAVAGTLYAGVNSFISPDVFAFSAMLAVLAALVIGGQATVLGPIVGGILITFLPEWLRVGQGYWQLLYGLILYFIVLRLPGGVVGLVAKLAGALLAKLHGRPSANRPVAPASKAAEESPR